MASSTCMIYMSTFIWEKNECNHVWLSFSQCIINFFSSYLLQRFSHVPLVIYFTDTVNHTNLYGLFLYIQKAWKNVPFEISQLNPNWTLIWYTRIGLWIFFHCRDFYTWVGDNGYIWRENWRVCDKQSDYLVNKILARIL